MTDAIYRRIENGETPLVAAYKGSKQISFAIIATTLILVAVFLPLILLKEFLEHYSEKLQLHYHFQLLYHLLLH